MTLHPEAFQPVGKNVEFVFDVSGSMCDTKMKQVTGTLGVFCSF